jgi:hypothetical protein
MLPLAQPKSGGCWTSLRGTAMGTNWCAKIRRAPFILSLLPTIWPGHRYDRPVRRPPKAGVAGSNPAGAPPSHGSWSAERRYRRDIAQISGRQCGGIRGASRPYEGSIAGTSKSRSRSRGADAPGRRDPDPHLSHRVRLGLRPRRRFQRGRRLRPLPAGQESTGRSTATPSRRSAAPATDSTPDT